MTTDAVPGTLARSDARRVSAETRGAWATLSENIQRCRRCPLGAIRTQAVIYRGSLAPWIVFVGEAPGAAEDHEGVPFVGRSGRSLDAAIAHLGLRAEEYGVLNVLKCRPPGNRFDRSAARTCRPFLVRQLELVRPKVLVPLGASALRALDPDAPPILRSAGTPRTVEGRTIFPLIHPAAALRSKRFAQRWSQDVATLQRWIARLA